MISRIKSLNPTNHLPFWCWFWGHKLVKFQPGERCARCSMPEFNFGVKGELAISSHLAMFFYNLAEKIIRS